MKAMSCKNTTMEEFAVHLPQWAGLYIDHPIVGDPKYFSIENWQLPGGMQNKLHLLARRIVVPHPRGGIIAATAPLPPHMQQSWNLLGLDASRYDPIVDAPEE